MIEEHVIKAGLAPSYFIEGMLSNVPNNLFAGTYENAFVNTFNWVNNADSSKLTCANGIHWLVRDNFHECWPTANFNSYMPAVSKYWEDWG